MMFQNKKQRKKEFKKQNKKQSKKQSNNVPVCQELAAHVHPQSGEVFTVLHKEVVGRYMVAARDIKAGEVSLQISILLYYH